MTCDRKKPGMAFWATVVVVVVLVAYPLSFGPVSRLHSRGFIPSWLDEPVRTFYLPCSWLWVSGPEPIQSAYRWYCELWI